MSNQVPAGWYPELAQYPMNVIANRARRNTQLLSDFAVRETFGNRLTYLTLSGSQGLPRVISVSPFHS